MVSFRKSFFAITALMALVYFLALDLEGRTPTVLDFVVFGVGFVSVCIFGAQSVVRLRDRLRQLQRDGEGRPK